MHLLHVFRLEDGPLEIKLMVDSCKAAANIKRSMDLAPKVITHKVSFFTFGNIVWLIVPYM